MLGLEFIKKLKPASFNYKESFVGKDHQKEHWGFIAQDILNILQNNKEYAIIRKDENNIYMVDHGELIAPLVKAVQELSERLEKLERAESYEK